jgi:acetolactate synthase-1/2/3 large subunit
MALMSGGEAAAATLANLGVRHVFGIVSVHNLPIYDAASRRDDIEVVNVRHEQAAAHAADAYSRATGELCAVLTSTGPGAVNAVPGLYEAAFVSSRVLMITGQIESRFLGKGKGFLHEHETQSDMLRSVCRAVATVRYTEDISREIARVADDIRRGRPQPGAVEIPIDLQYRVADVELHGTPDVDPVVPDANLLDQAADQLQKAERPLIWAGGGVNIAGAAAELTALAERLGAPVVTTIEGRGAIPEDHELCLGFRSDRGRMAELFEDADLLFAVGTRFQNYATRVWNLRLPEQLIHLDADVGVIGRNYPASLAVVGDARVGLRGLLDRVDGSSVDDAFLERARKLRAADDEALLEDIGPDHREIMTVMRRLLPREGRIARDSTVPNYTWGNRLLPILEPRTSIRAASAAIGPGLPFGIGAAVGTGQPTVVIQGDGGFMLSIGELAACAQHGLPVIVCLFNDGGYGVLRVVQEAVLGHRHGTELGTPDFVQVAEGMGVTAEGVASVQDFEQAFGRAVERASTGGGPTLLDIDLTALAPISFPLPAHQRRRADEDV